MRGSRGSSHYQDWGSSLWPDHLRSMLEAPVAAGRELRKSRLKGHKGHWDAWGDQSREGSDQSVYRVILTADLTGNWGVKGSLKTQRPLVV